MRKLLCFALVAVLIAAIFIVAGCAKDPDDAHFDDFVRYRDFGAIGNGRADDFEAIKKTHEYANEHGMAVKAEIGAKYYIKAVEDSIIVKTSVDWSGAKFIIDDKSAETDSKVWWYPLFRVVSDTPSKSLEIPDGYSLKAGQKNIGLKFDDTVMLCIFNENKKDFIRINNKDNQGYARQEILLVDKNGNVDETTPIQWDYEEVTKITAHSTTDEPVLLRGGEFTTIANDDPKSMFYFERGIRVERSNTTVKNVKHFVTDEGDTGSPYNGFFRAQNTTNVVFENCVMTGHKYYDQGTYDTRLGNSNNVKYLNCTQANSTTDATFWGVMCSDFCKNLAMDSCKLSRFDAHMGVYNAIITNSDIGQHINVTGGGVLRIENVTRRCNPDSFPYSNRFLTLREDYGSFFYGDIIIKNSTLYTSRGINYVIAANWYDHDFGYECRFPTTVTLDNVNYVVENCTDSYVHPCIYIFSHMTNNEKYTPEYVASSINPFFEPEKVIIKNNVNDTQFKLTANTFGWFEDTKLIYE